MASQKAESARTSPDDSYRQSLYLLMAKIGLYYLLLFAIGFGIFLILPVAWDVLPVGGLSDLNAGSLQRPALTDDVHQVENTPDWLKDAGALALAMFLSLLLMLPVSKVHNAIHYGDEYDHSIDETALILPAVVAGIVTIVQYSLALAFSLAGIMAGIRFRRALVDTFDTLFIFVAIGVGLAAGVGAIEIAIVVTVFFNYATLLSCAVGDGLESTFVERRKRVRQERRATKRSGMDRAFKKEDRG